MTTMIQRVTLLDSRVPNPAPTVHDTMDDVDTVHEGLTTQLAPYTLVQTDSVRKIRWYQRSVELIDGSKSVENVEVQYS